MKYLPFLLFCILLIISQGIKAQKKVNATNFVQAATQQYFKAKAAQGYFGKLGHYRTVIPIEKQLFRRMNRDTRYSSGIFDLSEPLTILMPETGDRFQSMTITNDHHYIKKTMYEPGTYTITKEEVGSRYVQVTFRTFVNANSAEDNAEVSKLQDQIIIKQKSAGVLDIPEWDSISYVRNKKYIMGLVQDIPDSKQMYGDKEDINPIKHLIGTAAGFGGINEEHAMYLNVYPKKNDGVTPYILEVPKDVPVDAFWSISVYNDKGYFQANEFDAYSYNNISAEKNSNGSISIHLGGDPTRINYIPITPGWSYNIRMYRPRAEILNGTWIFPEAKEIPSKEIHQTNFQSILDSANLKGAILLYDPQKNTYHSNDFEWSKKGRLPASTFKIPNSIIALETGVVKDDSTLFVWDGQKRALKIWEQDLILKEAFQYSCVPCYQEIARKIGVKRMNSYLQQLEYKDMRVDTTNIDLFWLEGDSKISQWQQIDFLNRLYQYKLPVSERSNKIMKNMLLIEDQSSYKLSGKTGWAIRDGKNNGWFVGYIEVDQKVYFFATNVSPKKNFDMASFPAIRKEVTYQALRAMGIL